MNEIEKYLSIYDLVVISKLVICHEKHVEDRYIFKKEGSDFVFGNTSFSKEELANIIKQALKNGFSVSYHKEGKL